MKWLYNRCTAIFHGNKTMPQFPPYYIGLMSGTSLDGVDGVIVAFTEEEDQLVMHTKATTHVAFPPALREEFMALQHSGEDEIHREAMAANNMARLYAQTCLLLLSEANLSTHEVCAIGAHGQTIRHQPELGFTWQTNNPALIAELTSMNVIADFRARDIAAGGQGAPLVPAFHKALFGSDTTARVVVNIGGISNISILPATPHNTCRGFDTGPGNVLLDGWISRQQNRAYDDKGAWAASGRVSKELLDALRNEPYIQLPPPKSTGRDLFNMDWLDARMVGHWLSGEDVQATLSMFTASTIADAIAQHAPETDAVYLCGGGAYNVTLVRDITHCLQVRGLQPEVDSTAALGVDPIHVEASAFAWLARQFMHRQPGNQPAVTGALGSRILGGFYPA